ncbi:MAG: hypothetical protein OJF51_004870 [Nitrospira sp.]|jgi:predicted DNA-binding transcriptional regulator AlpA|nr:MAG: hypothetical protein OJF51_004870 [Nitrospira sp.]
MNEQQTFEQIVTNLEQMVGQASASVVPLLVGAFSRLQATVQLRLKSCCADSPTPQPVQADRYLTVPEVMERFHVSAQWLYRHKRQLPHSQPSRKVLLFPEKAIERWFAARKA